MVECLTLKEIKALDAALEDFLISLDGAITEAYDEKEFESGRYLEDVLMTTFIAKTKIKGLACRI